MVSELGVIHPNVKIGNNCLIEEYVILGSPPRGFQSGELETLIGDDSIIRSHTVIYAGNKIGSNFQTGNKVNIREFNQIGNNVSVGTLTVIEHHTVIEDDVRIHSQAFIPEYTYLGKGAWIGPNVVLTNAKYPKSPSAKENLRGVKVGANAKIGANATILPGVVIGAHSLVGAGTVVVRDVREGVIFAGNPGRVIRPIDY